MEKSKKIKLFIGLFYVFIVSFFLYFLFTKFSFQEISSYEFIKNINKEFNSLLKVIPGSGFSNEWKSINSTSKGTEHKYKFISN